MQEVLLINNDIYNRGIESVLKGMHFYILLIEDILY